VCLFANVTERGCAYVFLSLCVCAHSVCSVLDNTQLRQQQRDKGGMSVCICVCLFCVWGGA